MHTHIYTIYLALTHTHIYTIYLAHTHIYYVFSAHMYTHMHTHMHTHAHVHYFLMIYHIMPCLCSPLNLSSLNLRPCWSLNLAGKKFVKPLAFLSAE